MRHVVAARTGARERTPVDVGVLSTPWQLAGREIPNRVVMAPLAGIGNWPFRVQAHRHGAGLVVSEMVASMGLRHGNRRTREMVWIAPEENLTAIQLFGADPSAMADAARLVEEAGAVAVDINMGCPVPKICKTGAGAALLGDLDRAADVVRATCEAVRIPVMVKMRRGLTPDDARPVEAAQRFADAGAAALAVHPRAAAEEYSGRADHRITAEVVRAVDIPVIASGDITTSAQAVDVMESTGCAAVMIGRAALGDPWLLGEMAGAGEGRPSRDGVVAELLWFVRTVREAMGDQRACNHLRKFYSWYLSGEDVPADVVAALTTDPTLDAALARIEALADDPAEAPARV